MSPNIKCYVSTTGKKKVGTNRHINTAVVWRCFDVFFAMCCLRLYGSGPFISSANQRSETAVDVSGRHRWLRGGAWKCMTAMADVTPDRPFHLVVFGATGFTGAFVVEEVARRAADSPGGGPLKWAVAGRCRRRLEDVLNRAADSLCRCSGRSPLWEPRSGRLFEGVTVRHPRV